MAEAIEVGKNLRNAGLDGDGMGIFRRAIIEWFEKEGLSYPWRETNDPYAILVSELMLQQTQVATVLGKGYYERWLRRFPDWESLAMADEAEILKAWEGLGYYNRARNLQKAARVVAEEYGGEVPGNYDAIIGLPGVGPYTAGALMSFAFEKRAPIVDGNVVRVLARLFGRSDPVDATPMKRFLWEVAEQMTPEDGVRSYNSGIMELGQRICKVGAPECERCPVEAHCVALRQGRVGEIPVKAKRTKMIQRQELVGLEVKDGRILLAQETGARRQGLWRLPELRAEEVEDLRELFRFHYVITKYRVELRVFSLSPVVVAELEAEQRGSWHGYSGGSDLPPMGAPFSKAIKKYQNNQAELRS